jgi:hypothetical protein
MTFLRGELAVRDGARRMMAVVEDVGDLGQVVREMESAAAARIAVLRIVCHPCRGVSMMIDQRVAGWGGECGPWTAQSLHTQPPILAPAATGCFAPASQ